MDPARKLALFEQTIIPHLNAAYNLAHSLTRNAVDAEDLVQEPVCARSVRLRRSKARMAAPGSWPWFAILVLPG